jgi:hypothetical protein
VGEEKNKNKNIYTYDDGIWYTIYHINCHYIDGTGTKTNP